ncbi:hypothetical protein [Streptomyces sp. NPDC005077]|uniref:hypothetical protein n=1 Tax=Streptomyces sp. NPDC005077 TaxID=3154292 RepID=UPI0033BD3843
MGRVTGRPQPRQSAGDAAMGGHERQGCGVSGSGGGELSVGEVAAVVADDRA